MCTRPIGILAALATACMLCSSNTPASVFEFAEHTPGYRLLAEGSRSHGNGFYSSALAKFERAAYWGDKMAQHNLGAMHYRSDGVDQDRARAWAWFELAAERGYPEFVAVADAVWSGLNDRQRERADRIFEQLRADYGDEVAVPRTQRRMERERRNATGSRTGSVGNLTVIDRTGTHDGEHFFAKDNWDFERVIEREARVFDALARGNVTVGPLELVDDQQAQSGNGSGGPDPEGDQPLAP